VALVLAIIIAVPSMERLRWDKFTCTPQDRQSYPLVFTRTANNWHWRVAIIAFFSEWGRNSGYAYSFKIVSSSGAIAERTEIAP